MHRRTGWFVVGAAAHDITHSLSAFLPPFPAADPAMGGPGGRPPLTKTYRLVLAVRLRHGGKFSLKSFVFGHFLYKNVQKAFNFPLSLHQGLCPWTPLGAEPPDPRLGSRALATVRPLANPGSATVPFPLHSFFAFPGTCF